MAKNVDAISSDQFFNDIMQGFEEASQYARGQMDLRVMPSSSNRDFTQYYHRSGKFSEDHYSLTPSRCYNRSKDSGKKES